MSEPFDNSPPPFGFDVCVVLLNFNGGELVGQVAEAALASQGVRPALVVVDNASDDGSDRELQELVDRYPNRSLFLRSGANIGFSAGNNLGLHSMPARAVCLLNPDAVVEPTTLATLLEHLDQRPEVGACGPMLVTPDGLPQSFSHGDDPSPGYLLRRAVAHRRGRTLHAWDGDIPRQVDWVAGTCLMIRTSAMDRVGLLDEGIFMYFEDNDYCKRLRDRGFSVDFVPTASVRHYNQPSAQDTPRRKRYYKGLARFYDRHFGKAYGSLVRGAAGIRLALGK
jgi:N-acetylglucosaminyl-diphospho-decaprenol L-rhamnosyltransferase